MSDGDDLGIVVALPVEARCLAGRRMRGGDPIRLCPGVWLHQCGMGPGRAQEAAEALLARGVAALASWGTAAALDPEVEAGTLVVPARVVEGEASYPVAAEWHRRVLRRLQGRVSVATGMVALSPVVVATASEKAELRRRTGAAAVDMESAVVVAAAQSARVPVLVLRAVSDSAHTDVPDCVLAGVGPDGRVRGGRMAASLIRRPRQFPELIRLAREMAAARRTLRETAQALGSRLLAE